MEHYIKVKYCKNDEQYIIQYKGIKQNNGRYLIHKKRSKIIRSDNIKMDSVTYLIHCLEHDIIKDNRIKNTDIVTVYTYLDISYVDILNKANQGKSAYRYLKNITNGQDKQYLIKFLKVVQKIYVKKQVSIRFKDESEVDMNIFNVNKIYKKEATPSYIVEQVKNTTNEEKEARREQFIVAFNRKNLNYEELINR